MPQNEKSQKRVEKLFSDLEQIARQSASCESISIETGATPHVTNDAPVLPSANHGAELNLEAEALLARIRELEARLKDSEKRAIPEKVTYAPTILYEKEEVGYAYSGNSVLPLKLANLPDKDSANSIKTSLTASGETIGEMKIEPPTEREYTAEEATLAKAVAQQVSLQIQNLRLLAAAERARAEAQAANRQFTHQNWESFMDGIRNSERIGYVYDQAAVSEFSEATPEEHDYRETVKVLDEQVGNLFLKADPNHPLTDEDKEMIAAVARQISQQVESLRLLADASSARANAEEATRRLTRENWQSFTAQKADTLGFAYDSIQVTPFGKTQIPQDITFEQPLTVRGETIGQLTVAGLKNVPPEAIELANNIAEHVSVHIETLRLAEELQKRAAEIEASEAKLSEAIIIAKLGNWEFDFENDTFTFNDNFYSVFHTNAQEVGGYKMSSAEYSRRFVHPDDAALVGAEIGKALSSVERYFTSQLEHRVIFADDGSIGYISVNINVERNEEGKIVRWYGANQDITERRTAQNIIAQRANQLETVATVSTTASTVLDPDELLQSVVDLTKERFNLYHTHIYLADESWNTLLLAAGAGEVGRQMVMAGHAIQIDTENSLMARATRERSALIVNNVRKEADYMPNPFLPDTRSEMAVPMISGDKVIGVFDVQSNQVGHFSQEDANIYTILASQVAVALQNARLYVEQSATVAQLRELDRLKSSFLANMSHELRTPLNSILGFADVMLEELDGPLTENMQNDLGLIYKNGQHLLHLINDVLDMAKIESGKMNLNIEKFNLQEIIEEVTSITAPLASEKNLALFIEPDSDHEVEINADKIRLRQVMINLINNSIKFTEKGKIAIRVVREDNNVLISVKDTGIGIPVDLLESVFQEFTQVDTSTTRKVGGTGLGLPISRRLIEMHSGRLWVESTGINGEGSTFYVFLPIEAKIKEVEPKAK